MLPRAKTSVQVGFKLRSCYRPIVGSGLQAVARAASLCRRGLAAGAAGAAVCNGDGPTGGDDRRTFEVEVVDFTYRPATVSASVGDTVRWIQRDPVTHTVTSSEPPPTQPGGFDETLEQTGDVVEVELTREATINYFCRPHPFMTGSITVER